MTYYRAPTQTSGSPVYSVRESFELARPRSDNPPVDTPEFPLRAITVGGISHARGAVLIEQRRWSSRAAHPGGGAGA